MNLTGSIYPTVNRNKKDRLRKLSYCRLSFLLCLLKMPNVLFLIYDASVGYRIFHGDVRDCFYIHVPDVVFLLKTLCSQVAFFLGGEKRIVVKPQRLHGRDHTLVRHTGLIKRSASSVPKGCPAHDVVLIRSVSSPSFSISLTTA